MKKAIVENLTAEQVLSVQCDPYVCQTCGVEHLPEWPHNKESLYYRYSFYREHKRFPTWMDALNHCDEEMKKLWQKSLIKSRIKIRGENNNGKNS